MTDDQHAGAASLAVKGERGQWVTTSGGVGGKSHGRGPCATWGRDGQGGDKQAAGTEGYSVVDTVQLLMAVDNSLFAAVHAHSKAARRTKVSLIVT